MKLTPAHLTRLAEEFNNSVIDGTIPVDDAMKFYEDIENAVFEARVRAGLMLDKDNPPHIKRKSNGSYLRR